MSNVVGGEMSIQTRIAIAAVGAAHIEDRAHILMRQEIIIETVIKISQE